MFQPVPVFVGLRYSLAREHSFFVSFITWVSLSGVALGVAILIVVLSVMNGLGSELRDRLLSVSAHASLNARGAAIPDWRLRIQQLNGAPGLKGAAPYLDTDAMLSRQPAMSGAIVRGIDPGFETQVSTIADSMREGKLSDLTPGRNRIILGLMLAYQLEVGVGRGARPAAGEERESECSEDGDGRGTRSCAVRNPHNVLKDTWP